MDTLTQDILMELDERIDLLNADRLNLINKKDKLTKLYNDVSTYQGLLADMDFNPTFKLVTNNSKFVMNATEANYSSFKAFIISALNDYVQKRQTEIAEVE